MFVHTKSELQYAIVLLFTLSTVFCVIEAQGSWWGLYELGAKMYHCGEKAVVGLFNFGVDHGKGLEAQKILEQQSNNGSAVNQTANTVNNVVGTQEVVGSLNNIDANGKVTNDLLKNGITTNPPAEGVIKTGMGYIVIISGTIYIIKSVGDFFRWIGTLGKKPTEEDSLRQEKIRQELKILKALNACDDLRSCLARNRNAIKDNDGIPVKCKDAAQLCLDDAGEEECNKIKNAFLIRQKCNA
jgi:hypothetical protein